MYFISSSHKLTKMWYQDAFAMNNPWKYKKQPISLEPICLAQTSSTVHIKNMAARQCDLGGPTAVWWRKLRDLINAVVQVSLNEYIYGSWQWLPNTLRCCNRGKLDSISKILRRRKVKSAHLKHELFWNCNARVEFLTAWKCHTVSLPRNK